MSTANLRSLLRRAFSEAVASIDLRALTRDALPPSPPVQGRVVLLAVGKAAPAMAAGALDRWGARLDRALVVTTDGTDATCVEGRANVLRASHPLPDPRSVEAAERAFSLVPKGPRDLLLALLSGGASTLLSAPPRGMSLDELREINAALLASGLPIQRINLLRRHLSRTHGGRIALEAHPARTLTLYASDIPQGEAFEIGSGPTLASVPDLEGAREILDSLFPPERAARFARFLSPPLDARSEEASHLEAHAIATPTTLAEAVADRLRSAGFSVRIAEERTAPAELLVEEYARAARSLSSRSALVVPCEPSLSVPPSSGRGGRAGWLALALLPKLPSDVAFLAGASDGVDGVSGSAGACVGGDISFDRDFVEKALASFDDAPAHAALGTALPGGPTGLNLTDVHVLARS